MEEDRKHLRGERESVFLSAWITPFGGGPATQTAYAICHRTGHALMAVRGMYRVRRIIAQIGLLEELAATVIWVRLDQAGIRFVRTIDLADAKARRKPEHIAAGWSPLV